MSAGSAFSFSHIRGVIIMASYQYVYVMKDLTKSYPGGREVFKGITLSFVPGAKIGILGVNGAGKSTLLKIMAGLDKEFGGEAWAAEGARVGYLEQEPQLDPNLTVGENVALGFGELKKAVDRFNEISLRFAEPMDDDEMNALLAEQAELQEKIDAGDGWELDRKLEIALDALRCPPADSAVDKLSGGERRRVALCRLLLEKPDLLLLDEPTNHLDAESVAWLEKTLRNYAGTVMVITHDRYFLDNVTNWILEIERGRGIPFEGNYSSWLEQKRKRLAQEEKEESARQRALAAEEEWIHSSPKARQSKSKARIAQYEEMLAASAEKVSGVADIVISPGPRLGGTVIEAEALSKGFADRLLIDNLNFKLPPGGIVGVIGPNGAGKSTLFKMIIGQEEPDAGSLKVGETVKLGYVDQSRDSLDPDKSVWEEISGGTDVIYLASGLCLPVPMWGRSTSRVLISRKKSASCRAVSVTACIWPRCSVRKATLSCLTNRPTIWTWIPCAHWKTLWRNSPAARSLSRMTAGSLIVWQRIFSRLKVIPTSSGLRVTSRPMRKTNAVALAPMPPSPAGFATSLSLANRAGRLPAAAFLPCGVR